MARRKRYEDMSLMYKAKIDRKRLTIEERHQLQEQYRQWYATPSYRAAILLSTATRAAKKMHLPCDLTKDWIETRLKRGRCEVSGVPFDMASTGKKGVRKFGPSLDRQNPKSGYTRENTRVVVWIYNLWKSNYSDEEVVHFAKILVQARHDNGKAAQTNLPENF